ncbi:MAG: cyclic nucleotide-binding domain-containing protein [Gammaproteobacteria bacterium]
MNPDSQAAAVQRLLDRCHVHKYAARQTILHAGSEADTIYFIVAGSVVVTLANSDGQELALDHLGPGEFFGEMGMFSGQGRSAEISTRVPSEIASISYDAFLALSREDPEILMLITSQMAERLRKTSRKAARQVFVDVTSRIAYTLMDQARRPQATEQPEGMAVRMSRQELARLAGCSREMAGRAVAELESKGLVKAYGKTIVVLGPRREPGEDPMLDIGQENENDSLVSMYHRH